MLDLLSIWSHSFNISNSSQVQLLSIFETSPCSAQRHEACKHTFAGCTYNRLSDVYPDTQPGHVNTLYNPQYLRSNDTTALALNLI